MQRLTSEWIRRTLPAAIRSAVRPVVGLAVRSDLSLPTVILAVLAALLPVEGLVAQAAPLSFAEEWALATDRAEVLQQLIPGTVDYYYYHCRHRQDTGAFDTCP